MDDLWRWSAADLAHGGLTFGGGALFLDEFGELPMEQDLTRWLAVWGAPGL